ncbi:hypothetical protein BMS3Bbin14_02014 [bacterium BMS3Bbin14]|nr:hypothetical protein BMS3Bbin14_02014 [bacterium BMS3Bbin14]
MSRLLRDQRMPALKNEQGTAIIAALLILMLLTFMAIAATNTTISEKAMVRSESIFEQNFYKAESAAMEGVQQMTNATLPQNLLAALNPGPLLRPANSKDSQSDLLNLDTNGDGVIDNNDTFDVTSQIGTNTHLIVIQMPIDSGSSKSLTQTSSRLYNYVAYGLSMADPDSTGRFLSVSIVKIGFKKRF